MLKALVLSLAVTFGVVGEGEEMVVGTSTDFHSSLIALPGHDFHGLQIAVRRARPCQVRAFFQGAPPRAAQFCAGRVTQRHVEEAGRAILEDGARVNGIAACLTARERIGAVRLYTFSGEAVTARVGECVTEFRTVWCQRGWTVQGLQLYFDRPAGGLAHGGLVGLRPLCVDSA
ncbi:hypothetical protein [uncultured Maricaulis sp.]|jgi:hypothetical protein|uniref:hypothetical protein n=1 Tax=uncultured Maricaulis sp. TaxID=174710 RepID=UPI0025EF29A8|nr:hypothetical protein [uncultured Maricaulis sp.]